MPRKKNVPKLSELEWEVMKPLWDRGPMAARDIFQAVPQEQAWAYKTLKTMLARLVKKGVLAYDQIGNSYLYRAEYTREEMTRATVGSFVNRVFDGAMQPFVACFAESVGEDELRVLRAELARIERARQKEHAGNGNVK
ncbi:MAG: BlaI/MecI/CopY family transcriptional regulator [Candidatus Hydrogenedentes bacterium]|nr:BlaI/MecI/CopY family transcriptional regulator [Candidatus Hydrogenedentota bacterium]